MKLICEYSSQVSTQNTDKNWYLTGVFSTYGVVNANGRVYPEKVLRREADKIIENFIRNNCCYGNLNHPSSPEVDLEKAAVLVENLEWHNKDLYGKAKVLNTPMGNTLKGILESGGKVQISSRGLGTVNEKTNEVNEDYSLITYDVVANASNPGSRYINGILEGIEFDLKTKKPMNPVETKKMINYELLLDEINNNYDIMESVLKEASNIDDLDTLKLKIDELKVINKTKKNLYAKQILEFISSIEKEL